MCMEASCGAGKHPRASGENSTESQEAERVQVETKTQSLVGKQPGKRVDILVLRILFPQTLRVKMGSKRATRGRKE